jgi:hypothetical protein
MIDLDGLTVAGFLCNILKLYDKSIVVRQIDSGLTFSTQFSSKYDVDEGFPL